MPVRRTVPCTGLVLETVKLHFSGARYPHFVSRDTNLQFISYSHCISTPHESHSSQNSAFRCLDSCDDLASTAASNGERGMLHGTKGGSSNYDGTVPHGPGMSREVKEVLLLTRGGFHAQYITLLRSPRARGARACRVFLFLLISSTRMPTGAVRNNNPGLKSPFLQLGVTTRYFGTSRTYPCFNVDPTVLSYGGGVE